MSRVKQGLRVIILLPGATDLDMQGRIKGSLDVPLCQEGNDQARRLADELKSEPIDVVYCGPCEAARQTAESVSRGRARVKVVDELRNIDRGLWHGKRVNELRDSQPRLYRQWQENPESVCPPGGETLEEARKRLGRAVSRILGRYRHGSLAIVIPEPAASLVRQQLRQNGEYGDLWAAECSCGCWESFELTDRETLTSIK